MNCKHYEIKIEMLRSNNKWAFCTSYVARGLVGLKTVVGKIKKDYDGCTIRLTIIEK